MWAIVADTTHLIWVNKTKVYSYFYLHLSFVKIGAISHLYIETYSPSAPEIHIKFAQTNRTYVGISINLYQFNAEHFPIPFNKDTVTDHVI